MFKFKSSKLVCLMIVLILSFVLFTGCSDNSADSKDREMVNKQQEHYISVQPTPFYDYSIPRDILIQIYDVVTQESRNTYTIIETIMGETKFHGPSVGYGIPADVSLTNPVKAAYPRRYSSGEVIEQAEPNGLYSSKNTDGTWVLFLDRNGDVTPIYTEHKVTTFPFVVKQDGKGGWIRADDSRASMTVKIKKK